MAVTYYNPGAVGELWKILQSTNTLNDNSAIVHKYLYGYNQTIPIKAKEEKPLTEGEVI